MATICDRSPCEKLIHSLGIFISGSHTGYSFITVVDGEEKLFPIQYCPFCGTRLSLLPVSVLTKYKLKAKSVNSVGGKYKPKD